MIIIGWLATNWPNFLDYAINEMVEIVTEYGYCKSVPTEMEHQLQAASLTKMMISMSA